MFYIDITGTYANVSAQVGYEGNVGNIYAGISYTVTKLSPCKQTPVGAFGSLIHSPWKHDFPDSQGVLSSAGYTLRKF